MHGRLESAVSFRLAEGRGGFCCCAANIMLDGVRAPGDPPVSASLSPPNFPGDTRRTTEVTRAHRHVWLLVVRQPRWPRLRQALGQLTRPGNAVSHKVSEAVCSFTNRFV